MKEIQVSNQLFARRRNEENYKTLRANIEFSGVEKRVIAITSSIPGEGKSTTSMFLAAELAKNGSKTLLVDADMRKSIFAERLGISRSEREGLSEILAGKSDAEEVMYCCDLPNLYMILAGSTPPNPAELVGSRVFSDLIEQLEQQFDYVIIDTPPLSTVIDAAIIGRVSGGMILVVGSDLISYRAVQRVKQQIERSGCRLLGAVLNKVKLSNRTTYGTYGTNAGYYSAYRDYYEVEKK